MNSQVLTSYQWDLVALSFLISVVGAFIALTATTRIKTGKSLSIFNTLMAGTALGGVGVWAMHFVGMLALDLDVATSFSMVETSISLVAAILAASLALGFVARAPESILRMLGAGLLLGTSVAFMHYLGMYGMKFGGFIEWDFAVVGVSVAIAIAASTAALWLAFRKTNIARRLAAAVVMAVAVSAMHYTGMSAAEFICTTAARTALPQGFGYIPSFNLASLVTVVSLTMAVLLGLDQFLQRTLVERPNAGRAYR
ncbi:MHYT domain-containing protein [Polaromonas sp. YR568]|jgi:NO-binding membrane sensor protein with MHYT domain|uniref:MHYT domain-containing protein n=1 Tax=Polaromonas sp. YR568 TaxID=1855301 RepID=UPI0031380CA1